LNLSQHLDKEGIVLKTEIIVKLERFASLLHEWNQIHNLTGAKSIDAIYVNIVDSLFPLTFIKTPQTLLDVGDHADIRDFNGHYGCCRCLDLSLLIVVGFFNHQHVGYVVVCGCCFFVA
jgi:hypothetical protein